MSVYLTSVFGLRWLTHRRATKSLASQPVGPFIPLLSPFFSRLGSLTGGFVESYPLGFLLRLGAVVVARLSVVNLALELAVAGESSGLQAAVIDGGADRTAWLAVVTAVAESACGSQLVDVGE